MTLQMLRCFAAVAESNSFAQAANQLYITQPAITHQIQALESELGVCLIDRTQRPARLTACGISFYNDVSDILSRISLAVDHVRDSAPFSDTLHIGCQSTIQLHFLPAIYRAYNQCCPDIYISSIELSDIRRGNMLSAPLNVAFLTRDCADEQKNIRYIPLYEGSFCCVVPQNHRLADRDMISAQDFEGEVLIMLDTAHCPPQMNELLTGLRMNCKSSRFYLSSSSLYTALMIEAGLGIAVMPDFVCPTTSDLRLIPFQTDLKPEFGLAVNADDHQKKVMQFINVTREIYGLS